MLLFNIHSKGIGPLSWLLRTITFLITLLQWSSTRSGYVGLAVTAMASENRPGEMEPKLLSILIGSNATISCRLSEPNSSRIWFFETKSKRRIKQPSDEIKILDPYTAILSIQNAVEQKSFYQCMVENQGIGLSAVQVGTLPLNVTDFACLVYDYEYMQCSFTKPKNMLMTRFDLEYRFGDDNSKHSCHLSEVPEQEHKLHCNVTDYFPIRDKYLFKLIGSNSGGTNVQQFIISNHKIVIPSALKVSVQNITSDSVTLTLQNLKISYYRMGLLYEIKIRDNHSDWRTEQTGLMENSAITCNVVINNLYSYWNYSIKVRVKSNVAEENDAHLWSEPSAITFRTGRRRPVRAPDAPRGSFDIDSAETQLWLYWGHLPENEYCGPNFHYIVNEIDSNGVVIDSIPVNETSLSVKWRNESIQTFSIKSANEDGPSEKGNIIRVYRRRPQYELNEENIAKVYHNSSYTLSWSPPANLDELDNFTVFWCLPKIESSNQCKGPISYKYLDKHTTSFTTEPKDRSLNLAISANYPMYSRGMQWARCSSQVSSELMKVELEVTALNESSVMVKWNSGSVCPSVLKGYNLTYCQACHCTPNGHCDGGTQQTVQLLPEFRNYTIHNLPSYTTVCLSMFMFSSVKRGRDSEYKCDRTKASAPSPPKNVSVKSATITSKSAIIEWSPPDVHNGILTHYTIHWRKIPNNTTEKATTYINQTSYNLTGLSSYSNYEVYVTAHTVEESPKSERITISTLIGIPSSPRNISIHNETMIYWDQPDLPSGRHVFYIVALLRHNKKEHKTAFQQVSVVRGRSCRYNLPDCPSSDMSYTLEVRAVNVGERDEIDTEIIPMSRDVILAGAEIDQSFCMPNNVEESDEDWAFIDDGTKSYFASPWVEAGRLIQCSNDTSALIYAVAFVIVIIFAVYVCHWIRNKYYKMKNIKVILPEGLVDQVSNYKFAGNALSNGRDLESVSKKEFHSDISRSNDCLVAFGHNDNHNLVSNFHNRSSNAPSSLSSDSSSKDHQNDDQIGEHPSLETTNEELSSNSSSSSHSNLTYHDHHQIQRLSAMDSKHTLNIGSCQQDEDDVNNAKEYNEEYNQPNVNTAPNIGDNGYVTHNTQLLASILNATERPAPPSFATSFPTMTTDGYIQPSAAKQFFQPQIHHPPPPTSHNGYTSVEALVKISTMPDETTQILTSPTLPPSITTNPRPFATNSVSTAHTSPVITDLEESDHHSKDVLSPNVATAPPALHQTNNNNNNTIFGYVTQQQLANFGTNVALAKELNT